MGVADSVNDIVTTRLSTAINWARSNSVWPMPFGVACCAIEMMAAYMSKYDTSRFGSEVLKFSPRQSDLLIVSGRISLKMMPVLQRIWEQMPEPKWCISMGACASSGGVFDTYAVVQGIDRFLPVDVYIPGCPPRPEQIIQSIIDLQDKIRRTGTVTGKEFLRRTRPEGPRPLALEVPPPEALVAPGDFATATRLQDGDQGGPTRP